MAKAQSMKTLCPKGHPYDAKNTHVSARGHRSCRTCRSACRRPKRTCSSVGCIRPTQGRAMCWKHYSQARESGAIPSPRCATSGCVSAVRAHGLCSSHWEKAKRAGTYGEGPRLGMRLNLIRWVGRRKGYAGVTETTDEIVALFHDWVARGRHCGMCRLAVAIGKECLDHDHMTGQFRGFLHDRCNKRLGAYENARDDIDRYLAGPTSANETRTA